MDMACNGCAAALQPTGDCISLNAEQGNSSTNMNETRCPSPEFLRFRSKRI
jgi:hypothetical protein